MRHLAPAAEGLIDKTFRDRAARRRAAVERAGEPSEDQSWKVSAENTVLNAEKLKAAIESVVENKEYNRARGKHGYTDAANGKGVSVGPKYPDGKYFVKFDSEKKLRSDCSPVLRRMLAATDAVFGRAKKDGAAAFHSGEKHNRMYWRGKMRGLDQPYGCFSWRFTHLFRIEIDGIFASIEALIEAILRAKLPCLPHCIVYNLDAYGNVCGPHLYFLLPANSPVWFDNSHPSCRRGPQKLYNLVVLAVTKKLKSIGADMSGACNPRDGKLPFSPLNSFRIMNETVFPSLAEWGQALYIKSLDLAHEVREQILERADIAGLDRTLSEAIFIWAIRRAWRLMFEANAATEPSDLATQVKIPDRDRSVLQGMLFDILAGEIDDEFELDAVERDKGIDVLRAVAKTASRRWDPAEVGENMPKNRGVYRPITSKLKTTTEKQSTGRTLRNKDTRRDNIWRASRAVLKLQKEGRKVTYTAVAEAVELTTKTIRANWPSIWKASSFAAKRPPQSVMGGLCTNRLKDTTGEDVETAFEAVDETAEVRLSRKILNRTPFFSLKGDADAVEARKVELRSCVLAFGEPGEFKRIAAEPVFEAADEALILADRQARKRARRAKKLRAAARKAVRERKEAERKAREAQMLSFAPTIVPTSEAPLQPHLAEMKEGMMWDTPILQDRSETSPEAYVVGSIVFAHGRWTEVYDRPDPDGVEPIIRMGSMIQTMNMVEGWSYVPVRPG